MLSALDTFHFLRPVWLLLIPLGWLLAWWLRRAGGALQAWRQIVDAELLEFLTVGDGKGGFEKIEGSMKEVGAPSHLARGVTDRTMLVPKGYVKDDEIISKTK